MFGLSHLLQTEGKLCRTELYFPFENESSTAVKRLSCWCVSGDRKNYSAHGLTYFFYICLGSARVDLLSVYPFVILIA